MAGKSTISDRVGRLRHVLGALVLSIGVLSASAAVADPGGDPKAVPPAPADPESQVPSHSEGFSYLNTGSSTTICSGTLPFSTDGGCLAVESDDISIQVTLHDEYTSNVSAALAYFDSGGSLLLASTFCGTTTQWLPPNTSRIRVWLDGATALTEPCHGQPGIKGTATAQYWRWAPISGE